MPELPEVETVRRTLEHQIMNEKITKVEVYYSPIIENVQVDEFINKINGQTFRSFHRYGKYLIFIFDSVSLITHLRMEGKFFIKPIDEIRSIHEHIIFTLASGRTIRYHDTRKFGKMVLIESTNINEIMKYPSLKKLGPEANTTNVTFDYLYNKLTKRHDSIKVALLDQEVMAGLGNIYVDEVCYLSKLHPTMSCDLITKDDVNNIIKYSKEVLDKAILAGGTTIRSYTSSLGVTGRFQLSLHVHSREGETCYECGTTIVKTFVGGRGTYYCPKCQMIRRPMVIGITGGIATGKSSVSKYITNKGYTVISSDEIVKKLYDLQRVKDLIKNTFGNMYITNNKINKELLGQLVYNNKEMRIKLNELIHPLVKERINNYVAHSNEPIIFIDVPLLYEAKFDSLCDKVIVVYTNPITNIIRLMTRDGISEEYANIKIKSQMSIDEKCEKANYIIDNSDELCYTYKQIDKVLEKIKEAK